MSRTLGGLEKYCYYREAFNYYHNIVSLATYSSDIPPPLLYEALKGLLAEENGFAMNTTDKGAKLGPLDTILYGDFVEYRAVADFRPDIEISSLHDIRFEFDSTKPLCKVFVFNKRHVAFVTGHLICDGTTIINFQQLLLKHLNLAESGIVDDPEASSVLFDKSKVPKITFPDSVESLIHVKSPVGFIVKTLTEHFAPTWLWNVFKRKTLGKYRLNGRSVPTTFEATPSLITKLESVAIGKDELSRLLKLGRVHNVRLTSTIIYVMARSFQGIIEKQYQPYDLPIEIPVNCRKFVNREEVPATYSDQSGCYVSNLEFEIPSKPLLCKQVDWEYIAAIQTELVRGIDAEDPHSLLGMLRIVDAKDYVKGLGDYGSRFCGPCVCVSNVGYFDLNKGTTEEDFQIKDICFSQTSGVMGSFVNVNVVGFDGGIRMTLCYDTAMPWAEKVPEMAENARRLFNELLSEPK